MKKHSENEFDEIFDFVEKRINSPILETFKQTKAYEESDYFKFRITTSSFHNTDFLICKYFYKPIHLISELIIPNEK